MLEPATAWSSEPGPGVHLITRRGDDRAWSMCASRSRAGARILVVLLHDAVLETEGTVRYQLRLGAAISLPFAVLACAHDARRLGVGERWAVAEYSEIIGLCAAAGSVISW